MGGLLTRILGIFLWPFKALLRLLTGLVGNTAEVAAQSEAVIEDVSEKNIFFRRLARPKLSERTASDLSLEEAREYVAQAERFYTYSFPLFTRTDFFYEEVEQDYINTILGRDTKSIDAKFLNVMHDFRKVLNSNSAKLFLLYTPLLLAFVLSISLLIAFGMELPMPDFVAQSAETVGVAEKDWIRYVSEFILMIAALTLLMLLYQWPYKVTQQQNLLGLDNYVTSKFSRINQNFQVAKRRSMNVERNMRMHQAAELKDEAGVWTLAYQWFALRLLFSEMTVRNALYQIRRNTILYNVGGFIVSGIICAVLLLIAANVNLIANNANSLTAELCWEIVTITGIFVAIANFVITRNAARDTLSVLQTDEWNRFHLVNLHETVRDHVGEDKLQIVTFRDRNRIE